MTPKTDFTQWLRAQLEERDMDQSELSRRATQAGHGIAKNTISRIMTGDRLAGPDACIAIAYGLGLPREEVFRARGWLLREPESIIEPSAPPRLVALARAANALDEDQQARLLDVWESALVAVVGSPARAREPLTTAVDALLQADEGLTPEEEVARLLAILKQMAPEAYDEYARRAGRAESTEVSPAE